VEVRRAYCSAVDHNVPVVVREGAATGRRLTVRSPVALRCLDYPTRCTGWCCPLHAAAEARAAGADDAATGGGMAAPVPGPTAP
jgi:hypothetical protein